MEFCVVIVQGVHPMLFGRREHLQKRRPQWLCIYYAVRLRQGKLCSVLLSCMYWKWELLQISLKDFTLSTFCSSCACVWNPRIKSAYICNIGSNRFGLSEKCNSHSILRQTQISANRANNELGYVFGVCFLFFRYLSLFQHIGCGECYVECSS